MKRTILSILLAAAATLAASARGEQTVAVFTVEPPMHCHNCENKIKTGIMFENGVNDITTDLQAQTVTVTFDSTATTIDRLVEAFTRIGFKATPSETPEQSQPEQ